MRYLYEPKGYSRGGGKEGDERECEEIRRVTKTLPDFIARCSSPIP